ncbi:alpha-ketoacid dehydrogenase subunit beta [Mycobacterium koreense]|uniref:3-methyl-2-oxobutanoate dehydrogenase subunit beta n=1 Tax=Mycolicibacillus koreensis TaxID=1069220 RepID=A0AA91PCC5_9MYCO|nr:alpha-ketoacid dehydrogenase subunit beta [Mycolicibacillus koreensis]MCV7248004.1 alpha-ketoacid dehydrogenase subunit beta [Mycolicibacillus koreensis]ODR11252.1 pyruvate dehydrogenase [Mycolicibacillus koreensis]OSC31869.1 alpha-ketoacid dehydrogenase subunit beta [Mycolicibacillus koreensis]
MTGFQALGSALDDALGRDPSVLLLGEDIADPGGGVFMVTNGLSTKYGTDRVRATPISEQAIMGAAIGAAVAGMRPVAEIMLMDFLAVCMDQLSNHAAKLRYMSGGQTGVPLTVRCAAGAGMQFGAQHSEMLEAWLTHIPGLKVVVPSNPADAKGLLTAAIFDPDPCVVVEQSLLYFGPPQPVPVGHHVVPLGQAAIRRPGSDITLISYGRQVHDAMAAAEVLAEESVDAEVIDLRSLVPLDEATVLESVGRTRRAVVIHEAVRRNGFGAEVASIIHENLFDELAAPVQRVGGANTPIPFAKELEDAFVPGVDDILAAARRCLRRAPDPVA